MGTSNLYVLVTLVSSTGVHGIVEYEGQNYFIELGVLDHMHDDTYSVGISELRVPINNGSRIVYFE